MILNEDDSLMFIMDAGWIEDTVTTVAKSTGQKIPPISVLVTSCRVKLIAAE